MGKFELNKSSNEKIFWNLKAGNGQVILTSEMYPDKAAATAEIEAARTASQDDANFEKKTSAKGEPYFTLAAAGNTLGRSEMYSSESARDNGIASVKSNAPDAKVDDNTGG